MNESKINWLKRALMLCVGLLIMAFGVAFSIKAGLGTSPISSLPYVLNCLTPLTVGTATICMHVAFILLQILLLRRDYQWMQLLQLPVALIFGYLTDFAIWAIQGLEYSNYLEQWIYCVIGILLVAVGVSCEVTANVVTLAGEGLVLAICKKFPFKFGYAKVGFDVSLVCISILLAALFLKQIVGVREGTVAAALLVGLLAKQINKPLGKMSAVLLHSCP